MQSDTDISVNTLSRVFNALIFFFPSRAITHSCQCKLVAQNLHNTSTQPSRCQHHKNREMERKCKLLAFRVPCISMLYFVLMPSNPTIVISSFFITGLQYVNKLIHVRPQESFVFLATLKSEGLKRSWGGKGEIILASEGKGVESTRAL